jgi:hypothetical protein
MMYLFSLRWRKEILYKNGYYEIMIASFSKDWSVKQTLEQYPETISIFLRLKTNCIGCWLERFCTLEEVSSYYEISTETLLDAMRSSFLIDDADK